MVAAQKQREASAFEAVEGARASLRRERQDLGQLSGAPPLLVERRSPWSST
jgi:hypothetical protein